MAGDYILLDVCSNVGALAHELRGFEKLSVTTPGINTLQELADSEGIEVDSWAAGSARSRPRVPGRRRRHGRRRHL